MVIRNNVSIREAQGKYDVAEKPPAPFPQTVYISLRGFSPLTTTDLVSLCRSKTPSTPLRYLPRGLVQA